MSSAEISVQAPSTISSSDPAILAHVNKIWFRIFSTSPVYAFFLNSITITHAAHGYLQARLTLGPNHINSKHTLHGSVSATLVDWAGGLVIATVGLESTGLSTDLNVTYVSTAKEFEDIIIEARLLRAGRNMAFTRVEIRKVGSNGEEGDVIACGNHTKYIKRDVPGERK